jgi:hypothetical protein
MEESDSWLLRPSIYKLTRRELRQRTDRFFFSLIDNRTDGCDFSVMRGKVVFGPVHKTKTEDQGRGPMDFQNIGLDNAQLPAAEDNSGRNRGRCGPVGPEAPSEKLLDWMEAQMYTIFGTAHREW